MAAASCDGDRHQSNSDFEWINFKRSTAIGRRICEGFGILEA